MKKAASKGTKEEASRDDLMQIANSDYEAKKRAGEKISIAEVEEHYGIEPGKLRNWRQNHPERIETAVPSSVPVEGQRLETVPLDQVSVCPLNPRKRIDPAGIDEMAESILAHGIIQPPVARPRGSKWEVVFGQRRLLGLRRARELAKERGLEVPRPEIALLIREMDDNTVREEAWVENLQRIDVSVREEAQGFEELLALKDAEGKPLYTVTSLAAKLGKKPQIISRRLKLGGVPEDLWVALEAGHVGVRQLELVGCVPGAEARAKAAGLVLRPQFRPDPLTVRETEAMIQEEFLLSLRGAEWKMKDAELVPVVLDDKGVRMMGGACEDCPFRTGNAEELQEMLSDGSSGARGWDKNSCLKPECAKRKKAAVWKRERSAAMEAGLRVLTEEEARKTFSAWGGDDQVERGSGMVVLSAKPGYEECGHHAGEETLQCWEQMIGTNLPAEEVVLARNPKTGAVRRLLPRKRAMELAEKALKAQGKPSPFEKAKKEKEKENAGPRERSERELKLAVDERVQLKVEEWIRGREVKGEAFSREMEAELAVIFALQAASEQASCAEILEAIGVPVPADVDDSEVLEERIVEEVRKAALEGGCLWILAEIAAVLAPGMESYGGAHNAASSAFFSAMKVPMARIREEAESAVAAEEMARMKGGKKGKA